MDVVVRSLTDEIKKKFTEVRIFKFLNAVANCKQGCKVLADSSFSGSKMNGVIICSKFVKL